MLRKGSEGYAEMPLLSDINNSGAFGNDPQKQIDSVVRQLNEWGRVISNEKRTEIYKDNSNTNRIIIGVLPDGDTGIVISKEGVDVTTLFS